MIPQNELGVIVEFSRQCGQYGYEIISIRAEFPDAIIEKDGVEYLVEFEFVSSNFYTHGHDVRGCDLIICWENDKDIVIPVIELSDPKWYDIDITKADESEKEALYWKLRALRAESSLKRPKRGIDPDAQAKLIELETEQILKLEKLRLKEERKTAKALAKIQQKETLPDTRENVINVIEQQPGISQRELGRIFDRAPQTVLSRVDDLIKKQVITVNGDGVRFAK